MAGQADPPTVMPMKLIASWDLERSNSATCVPRLCTLTLTHLESLRVLEPGLQRITIGVTLKGSRHTLRSNDIEVNGSGPFSLSLQITFALQYPHFIKRDVNVLRVMLQRRKRYKTTPIPGYRTLAVGQVNLAEVIQHDVGSELFLYAPKNKDGEAEHVSTVSLGQLTSHPVDSTRHNQAILQHDIESSDEEQEFYEPSDDEEAGNGMYDVSQRRDRSREGPNTQRLQPLNVLKGMAMKRLNRGKLFTFPRSRGKLADAECEGDAEMENEAMEMDEDFGGSDFLPSDDADMSDSDFELDPDTMSVRSTQKPVLRPFYAPSTTSSSSASLRGPSNVGGNQRNSAQHPPGATSQGVIQSRGNRQRVEHGRDKVERMQKKEEKDRAEKRESRDRGDHGELGGGKRGDRKEGKEDGKVARRELKDSRDDYFAVLPPTPQQSRSSRHTAESFHVLPSASEKMSVSVSGTTLSTSLGNPESLIAGGGGGMITYAGDLATGLETSGKPAHAFRQRSLSALPSRRALASVSHRSSVGESATSATVDIDPEAVGELNEGSVGDRTSSLLTDLPKSIILLNACDPHGLDLGRTLVDSSLPFVVTMDSEQVQVVMATIMAKLQKYCSSHTGDPSLGVCIIGSEGYTNTILQSFVKLITNKSSIKVSFFRFFIVPLGVNRLAPHLASTDSAYRALFQDLAWKETFDSHESQWDHISIDVVARLNRYLSLASSTRQLPIAQALVNRVKTSGESDSGQLYVYFLNEVRVGAIDPNDLLFVADEVVSTSQSVSDKCIPHSPSTVVVNPLTAVTTDGGTPVPFVQSPPPTNPPGAKDFALPSTSSSGEREVLDLSLDYWPVAATPTPSSGKKEKESGKLSARTAVRCAWVTVLPTNFQGHPSPPSAFTMVLVPKEKSKRALPFPLPRRSHARDKEKETIENAYISKLVCSPKRSPTLKVYIDTVEWPDVKFFSLLQPGRTLSFPVAVFSETLSVSISSTVIVPELSFQGVSPTVEVDPSVCTISDV